jgi:hypothetical protein
MKFTQTSYNKVARNLQQSQDATFRGMSAAADAGIIRIFAESQRLVPVEFGPLKQSGKVSRRNYKYTVSRSIKYGGKEPGPYYAVYVHEDLTKKHKAPTRAKFLEIPFVKYEKRFGIDLRKYVRGHLEAVL